MPHLTKKGGHLLKKGGHLCKTCCGEPGTGWIQGVDCKTDDPLPVWVPTSLTPGTKVYPSGAFCISFTGDTTDTEPTDFIFAGLPTGLDECDDCTPPGCPTDNDEARSAPQFITLEGTGCDSGINCCYIDGAYELAPSGSGGWGFTDGDMDLRITCSGDYWILTVTWSSGGTLTVFRKLRIDDLPTDGAETWDLVSTNCAYTPHARSV